MLHLIAAGVLILALIAVVVVFPRVRSAVTCGKEAVGEPGASMDRALGVIRTVKAGGAEEREIQRADRTDDREPRIVTELQNLPVEIEVDEGRVAVTATHDDRVGTAVIERHGSPAKAEHVPIGTRDAKSLTMLVDSEQVVLRPGPGRYMRGSYKVRVRHGAVAYNYRPKSPDTHRLFRDGARLGDFEIHKDGSIDVTWHEGATPTATDAAVGYALAAAFGTGAQFFIMMMLDLFGQVPD